MIGIIGATGNIGVHLVSELKAKSVDIVALSSRDQESKEINWRKCDLWDEESLLKALRGCDSVFYLIPLQPSWPDFYLKIEESINVFLRVAEKINLKHVVALSSLGAHSNEQIGMFHMARILEKKLSHNPFKVTFIRPGEFMENWKHSIPPVQYEGVLPNFHLPEAQAFHQVSVVDIAHVAARALQGEFNEQIIHVLGPNPYSALDVKTAFEKKFSKQVHLVTPPKETWITEFQKYGLSESYARELVGLYGAIQKNLIQVEPNRGITIRGVRSIFDVINSF